MVHPWTVANGPPPLHPLWLFLLPAETWWHFTHPPYKERQVPHTRVGVGVNTNGYRLAFLRRSVPCRRCRRQGPDVLATGRKQVRHRRGPIITWLCRACALLARDQDVRRLGFMVAVSRRRRAQPIRLRARPWWRLLGVPRPPSIAHA